MRKSTCLFLFLLINRTKNRDFLKVFFFTRKITRSYTPDSRVIPDLGLILPKAILNMIIRKRFTHFTGWKFVLSAVVYGPLNFMVTGPYVLCLKYLTINLHQWVYEKWIFNLLSANVWGTVSFAVIHSRAKIYVIVYPLATTRGETWKWRQIWVETQVLIN